MATLAAQWPPLCTAKAFKLELCHLALREAASWAIQVSSLACRNTSTGLVSRLASPFNLRKCFCLSIKFCWKKNLCQTIWSRFSKKSWEASAGETQDSLRKSRAILSSIIYRRQTLSRFSLRKFLIAAPQNSTLAKCLVLCGISHYNNAAKQEPPIEIEPLLVFSSWRKQRENLFCFHRFCQNCTTEYFQQNFHAWCPR